MEADVPAKKTRAADGGGGNSAGADGDGDAGGVVDGVVDGDGDGDAGASSLRGGRETFDERRPPSVSRRTRCRRSRSLGKESRFLFLFSASTSRLGTDVHTSQ